MKAILFGSIGTITDSSELQRACYNQAFDQSGTAWHWGREQYQSMLQIAGGKQRLLAFAAERGQTVDVDRIHALKTSLFHHAMDKHSPSLREGVAQTLEWITEHQLILGLISGTDPQTVSRTESIIKSVRAEGCDIVTNAHTVTKTKPSPAIYEYALAKLDLSPHDAIAIEDNPDGVSSAKSAGLTVIAFPGENNRTHCFDKTDFLVTDNLLQAVLNARDSKQAATAQA